MKISVTATSVLCPLGRGTEQVWAAARAGISGIRESAIVDRDHQPLRFGLVPEAELDPLPTELHDRALATRHARMLRLAGSALAQLAGWVGASPATLYLAFPEHVNAPNMLTDLGIAGGIPINVGTSRIFPMGRAGAFAALDAAVQTLAGGTATKLIVGGVDSYLDLRLIADLDFGGRLLTRRRPQGFIPGEGAAFVLLELEPQSALAIVSGVAIAEDPGCLSGSAPNRGEGLAQAIEIMREALPDGSIPAGTVYTTLNGEPHDAKSWGVARVRHGDLISAEALMSHPADSTGDTGAASGAILLAIAAEGLAAGGNPGSALVWGASDGPLRGCALLSRT